MWLELTFGPSFKVNHRQPNLKVLVTCLLLVLQICSAKQTYRKSWGWEFSDVVRLGLWPLFKGQKMVPALVNCLSSGYKFALVLQCARFS